MSISIFSIGWLPDLDLKPLRCELAHAWGESIDFRNANPSIINKLLTDFEVHMAISSSIYLLRNTEIAVPVGVVASNSKSNIYLGLKGDNTLEIIDYFKKRVNTIKDICHHTNLDLVASFKKTSNLIINSSDDFPLSNQKFIPTIKISPHSGSGSALARIFYRLIFGKNSYDVIFSSPIRLSNIMHPDMELLIGNDAIYRHNEFTKIIDLSKFWHTLTGLPFVSGIIQKMPNSNHNEWNKRIIESAELAQAKMKIEPSEYFPQKTPMDSKGNPVDLASFWKCISYRLGPKEIKGLLLFLCLSRPLIKATIDESVVAKMLQWQEKDYVSSASL